VSAYTDRLRTMGVAETEFRLCLQPQLVAEHERLVEDLARLADTPDGRLNSGGQRRRLAEQIRQLEESMAGDAIVLKLRSLGMRYGRLVADHPPRKAADGTVDERDRLGFNVQTFPGALIRASVCEPAFDDEDWEILLGDDGKLSDRQYDDLFQAAWSLNRRDVDVPFSLLASQILASESGSSAPNGSASASNASTAGSRRPRTSTTKQAG
jgi:hypothetical protein